MRDSATDPQGAAIVGAVVTGILAASLFTVLHRAVLYTRHGREALMGATAIIAVLSVTRLLYGLGFMSDVASRFWIGIAIFAVAVWLLQSLVFGELQRRAIARAGVPGRPLDPPTE